MKILVVVDMQYDFTTGPLGNKECAAVIPNVISAIKNDTYDHIIFTKDTHQIITCRRRKDKNFLSRTVLKGQMDGTLLMKCFAQPMENI